MINQDGSFIFGKIVSGHDNQEKNFGLILDILVSDH